MANPIHPCLWFDNNAKEAADFYCSVFKNSAIISESPLVVIFELNGRKFMGLNGGPVFKFNEAVSMVVECEDQQEIDYFWETLTSEGGEESRCGWLKDKFGLSWQIVPANLGSLMSEPGKAQRVMNEVLKMNKIDWQTLVDA